MKSFQYVQPGSIEDAARASAEEGSYLKAAGTDVLDLMKGDVVRPDRLVNLMNVPGMREVEFLPDGIHIGALVNLSVIAGDARIPAVLRDAAERTATPQIRNMATFAGCLCQRPRCWYLRDDDYDCLKKGGATCYAQEGENRFHAIFHNKPCAIVHPSNIATGLAALDADVVTNKRTIPIGDFFVFPYQNLARENALANGEIVTKVIVKGKEQNSAYIEVREKQSHDWALVSAAVSLQIAGGKIDAARIVMGSVAPTPLRSSDAEKILVGQKVSAKIAEKAAEAAFRKATPLAQNAYKITMGRAIVKRAILMAAGVSPTGGR